MVLNCVVKEKNDLLIYNLQKLVILTPLRGRDLDGIADALADQAFGEGGGDGDPALVGVGFVGADDLDRHFLVVVVHDRYGRAEFDHVAGQAGGVDDIGEGHGGVEFLDTALDKALALARGVVFGVFRQVAMRARLRDRLDHGRALDGFQVVQLGFQRDKTCFRDGNLFHNL